MYNFYNLLEHWRGILEVEKEHELLSKMRIPAKIINPHTLDITDKPIFVTNVAQAKDGTIRSYLSDSKEPVRYYTPSDVVYLVAIYKRLLLLLLQSLENQGWFKRIITLLALQFNSKIFGKWMSTLFGMYEIRLQERYWSEPVKEVRKVLKGKLDLYTIDALSLILEYDSAYRYRFQDVMAEYDGNPLHLFDILIARDYDMMREKWIKIKKITELAFKVPKVKKFIKGILDEINIDKVKMNFEDIYHTNKYDSYQYRGLSVYARRNENIVKYGVI
jgi:hypothetical protein